MYTSTLEYMIRLAVKKRDMMNQQLARYFVHAMMAGAFVGLGIVLIYVIGAPLYAEHSAVTWLIMGVSFGVALTLVVFAGGDLFTGNNMYFTISTLSKATTWRDACKNWAIVWLGNLAGAMVLVMLVAGAGIFKGIGPDHLLMSVAAKKMSLPYSELFFRGILCNWFVCLSLWTSSKTKEDTAKLILIWWMLFGFIASGYEHSVANMSLLGLALWLPHPDTVSLAGWFHNLVPVTLGNIVGGAVFMGAAYWFVNPVRAQQPVKGEAELRIVEREPKGKPPKRTA